ncbi:F-box/LRR-repeat protein 4-like isoform X2 [Montipora capricornis]|uniref:F-box/LRR-repeat protein 4-like isoform X2 n=1 Tax=Montipora capricornis TaxID=246305 RepID=UPI0035F17458
MENDGKVCRNLVFNQSVRKAVRMYGPWWNLAPSGRTEINKESRKSFISEDFVDLEFKDCVIPTDIEILETYNPGAVVRILALLNDKSDSTQANCSKRWTTLWSGSPQKCPAKARKFSPRLKKINYPTNLIRLEFNQQHLNYYTELDAVYLSGIPASSPSCTEQKPSTLPGESDMSLTAHLLRQLSLNEEKESLTQNGFFDILPSELIHHIFSFLELIDLTRAARTCRLFFLHCYDPVWYKELDLKPYWSLITNEALDSLQIRCSSTEKLDLSWAGPYGAVTSPSICRFLQHCGSKLVCLRLSCCQYVNDEVINSISRHCPYLEELDLQSCSQRSKFLTQGWLARLEALKELKRINLYRVSQVTDDELDAFIHSMKGLQHLNLGGCTAVLEGDRLMQSLSVYCRSLVSLDLWRNKGLTAEGIVCLADGCVLLQELDIGWCISVASPACVAYLASKCKKLRKLFVTAIRCINDDVIGAITDHCPDIEQVDVLGTGLIHSNSITRLLRQCKKLQFLDVSFCSQLSTEFIRNLQAMYPNVSLKKSFVVNEDPL